MVISILSSSYSTIPPLLSELQKDEVSRWGFSHVPEIKSFNKDGLYEGHTYNWKQVTICRYNELISEDKNFKNPYACHNMVLLCDIAEYSSLCCDLLVPKNQHYETMRAIQNQKWAEQRLLRGVEYAKEGKYKEALRCYAEAIELVPKYAEAYTARGAA